MIEYTQINKCMHHINQLKARNHIITQIDVEIDNIQYAFILKCMKILVIEGIYHNTIKAMYDKIIIKFYTKWKKYFKSFPLN